MALRAGGSGTAVGLSADGVAKGDSVTTGGSGVGTTIEGGADGVTANDGVVDDASEVETGVGLFPEGVAIGDGVSTGGDADGVTPNNGVVEDASEVGAAVGLSAEGVAIEDGVSTEGEADGVTANDGVVEDASEVDTAVELSAEGVVIDDGVANGIDGVESSVGIGASGVVATEGVSTGSVGAGTAGDVGARVDGGASVAVLTGPGDNVEIAGALVGPGDTVSTVAGALPDDWFMFHQITPPPRASTISQPSTPRIGLPRRSSDGSFSERLSICLRLRPTSRCARGREEEACKIFARGIDNELDEGTGIAETLEFARTYIHLPRKYADAFNAGRRPLG